MHEVLQTLLFTGLEYSYRIPDHCSTKEQRSVHGLTETQRLRMISYTDDIAELSNDLDGHSKVLRIYDKIFSRSGLKAATDKIETMAFNVPEEIKYWQSLFFFRGSTH